MLKPEMLGKYTGAMLFLALVVLAFFVIKPLVLPLFFAGLLGYMLQPLYRWIKKKTKKPNISSFAVCSLVVVTILIPTVYFFKLLLQESYVLYLTIKQKLAIGVLTGCDIQVCNAISEFVSIPQVQFQIQEASRYITNITINWSSDLLSTLPSILLNAFVMIFALFYFLRDGPALIERIGYYLSVQKAQYAKILRRLQDATRGIVYGYLLIALIQGILGLIGFFIFGVESAIFWSIVMTFFALIPFAGTGVIWGPAGFLMLTSGITASDPVMIWKGVGLLAYGIFVISSIDNILRPSLMGDKAKIHPAIIMLGIFGGLAFFGIFGVIIGPIVLSLASIVVETYLGDKPSKKEIKKIQKILKAG
ncbi:AI-2E family transporter [archaeon]|jgi:predicted PurR-regulated permease PerM|nr:AI-2E family transporter [archaeon]MBT6697530.1 AI-2E family transporter [archaeon]